MNHSDSQPTLREADPMTCTFTLPDKVLENLGVPLELDPTTSQVTRVIHP